MCMMFFLSELLSLCTIKTCTYPISHIKHNMFDYNMLIITTNVFITVLSIDTAKNVLQNQCAQLENEQKLNFFKKSIHM